jgi:hypothetical protein
MNRKKTVMKRILKIISSALFFCIIPFSLAMGQGKKSEQKIKIVIDDGSGTKVVIDTLIKDGQMTDSLKLKDGKVVYIGNSVDKAGSIQHGGNEHVFVTVSADGNATKKVVKEITIVSSDSANWKKEGGETFEYTVKSDNKESKVEKTKYVIAKDGMVITVEGNDDTKVKELINEIESKLDIKKEGVDNSVVVKEKQKK